jgi:hypothetical protein
MVERLTENTTSVTPTSGWGSRYRFAASCSALLLLVPFINFTSYHGYSLLAPEILNWTAIIILIGVFMGAVMMSGSVVAQTILVATLITLFIDIQKEALGLKGQYLWLVFLGAGAVCILLRTNLTRNLTVVLLLMLVTTLLLPAGQYLDDSNANHEVIAQPDAGPPIVHLILDEQIGTGGIPIEFDSSGRLAGDLESFYVDRDFQLFSRAYSRYYNTHHSMATLVNLRKEDNPRRFYEGRFQQGMPIIENRYFEEMSARGYAIDVIQTDYIDFCNPLTTAAIRSCFTYSLETIKAIESAPLNVREKMRIIGGMYIRLSYLLPELRTYYNQFRNQLSEIGVMLPPWSASVGRVSPLSTLPITEILSDKLATIGPGSLVFAHLALPHYPFVFDRNCKLRSEPTEWLNGMSVRTFPRRNDAFSRAQRYPVYIEQVECTHRLLSDVFSSMKAAGTFDDSIIIVHGDHGSRLDLGPPNMRNQALLTERDFVDAFSTLFAVHFPNSIGQVDDRMIPLDALLNGIVKKGAVPPGKNWFKPGVFLTRARGPMVVRKMPDF